MAALHIVNKAAALASCLPILGEDDALLLIEDGVYAARLASAAVGRCYVLDCDLEARGLTGQIAAAFEIVTYDGFVELVERHQPIVSWNR